MSPVNEPDRGPTLRRLATAMLGAALAAPVAVVAVPAEAAVKYDLAAEAGATLANNPLLVVGPDTSALAVEVSIEPGVTVTNATGSSLVVDGVLTARSYSRRYGSFLLGRARADAVLRRDERLSALAAINFQRDLSADILTDAVDAGVDPRSTRNILQGALSLAWTPDARMTVTPRLRVESARFTNSRTLADSNLRGAELRIARRTSARTSVGIAALGTFSDIGETGRFSTLSLLATLDHRFNPALRATGEFGVERNRDRVTGLGATRFSGRAQLCRQTSRSAACLNAAVASEASAIGALQRRYTIGASVRRTIADHFDIGLAADYQRASQSGTGPTPTFSAATVGADLDWQFARRLSLGAHVEYRQRDQGTGRHVDGTYAGISLRWQK